MTIQQFFDANLGKGLDFDHYYGDQCVDLAQYYNRDVVGGPVLTGNAADIWTSYPQQTYTRIANSPSGVPMLGDIVIWDGSLNGGPGHIAVFKEGDANHFTSFDQNWPLASLCHFQSHDYAKVLGWLHPIAPSTPPSPVPSDLQAQLDAMRTQRDHNWDLYQSELTTNANLQKQLALQQDAASKLTDCQKLNIQAETDRTNALARATKAEKAYQDLAHRPTTSYTTAASSVLINELLTRFVNKLTRR